MRRLIEPIEFKHGKILMEHKGDDNFEAIGLWQIKDLEYNFGTDPRKAAMHLRSNLCQMREKLNGFIEDIDNFDWENGLVEEIIGVES